MSIKKVNLNVEKSVLSLPLGWKQQQLQHLKIKQFSIILMMERLAQYCISNIIKCEWDYLHDKLNKLFITFSNIAVTDNTSDCSIRESIDL